MKARPSVILLFPLIFFALAFAPASIQAAPLEGVDKTDKHGEFNLSSLLDPLVIMAAERYIAAFFGVGGICSQEQHEDIEICEESEPVKPLLVGLGLESYKHNPLASRAVERNITMFTERMKEIFSGWLARSGKYIPMMKEILREEGVPEEMAFLPLVESGFNPRAYSRRKAAGPWQFIAATAKRYGLKINWWVDERRDPVKSTRAAARYLKDLHKKFGSWDLAMAAYNAGENRIRKALRRTRNRDYWSIRRTRHIRRETKNYIPKFIAARLIAASPENYGFYDVKYHQDFSYDEVLLESSIALDVIAGCTETTVDNIKELNPELRRRSTPPVRNYVLRIPRGKKQTFVENLSKILPEERFTVKVYTVKKGDTISEISQETGVPARAIIAYNKINRRALIRVGQKLLLPVGLKRN